MTEEKFVKISIDGDEMIVEQSNVGNNEMLIILEQTLQNMKAKFAPCLSH